MPLVLLSPLLVLLAAAPDLVVSLSFVNIARFEPSASGRAVIGVRNLTTTPATHVVLTVTAPDGGTLDAAEVEVGTADCSIASNTIICTSASVGAQQLVVEVRFTTPDRLTGGAFTLHAEVRSDETDADSSNNALSLGVPLVRHLIVDNTNDSGSGSLRQTLLEANASCVNDPCDIDFRIPAPAGAPPPAVFTIAPLTPLPPVRGKVTLDGATQAKFLSGTSVEINGAMQDEADGLRVGTGCSVEVSGLIIDDFRGYGILVHQEGPQLDSKGCAGDIKVPAVTIARNTIERNYRGIYSEGGLVAINDNRIARNRRSGIFAWTGFYAGVTRNRIVDNGASGVYLNVGGPNAHVLGGGSDVTGNVISGNTDFGVARSRDGEISVTENSIYGNGHGAIDVDLDLATPNRSDDRNTIPNKPDLFSASYDPAMNQTIVRGMLQSTPGSIGHLRIDFYASHGLSRTTAQPEAETFLQHYDVTSTPPIAFEVAIPGDLRGQWITATNSRTHTTGLAKPPEGDSHIFAVPSDTSELSNPLMVR